jgi:hypothetical protein
LIKILSHRGVWSCLSDQNTIKSFDLAIKKGFGIELDVRDFLGKIYISHDPILCKSIDNIELEDFLMRLERRAEMPVLAINIKTDGLLTLGLESILSKYKGKYFVFDSSIPQAIKFLDKNLPVYGRVSEYEPVDNLLSGCVGVWLDQFTETWYEKSDLSKLLKRNFKIVIVSPELHSRDHLDLWKKIKDWSFVEDLYLCTDYGEEAKDFFL